MNVLLLIFDGVRYDHVDTGDHSDSPTPALSDFARTATEYTRAYAPSIWSLPSHVSLFTGHHSVAHGVNTISDTLQNGTTIWSELATRGYSTGLFSANPYLTLIDTGIQSEFDHVVGTTEIPFYEALTPDESSVTSGSQSPHLDYLRECFTSDSPFRSLINGIDSSITPLPFLYDDDTAPYFADQFLEWVDDQSGPWAGCLNFMDTHFPYLPSEEHNRWGDEQLFDIQDAIDEGMWEFTSGKRPWWQRRALSALYKGCIRQADAAVDRILSHLQQQDELDETLIVVTSDHGEGFGEDGFYFHQGHKRSVADFQTKVPVVFDGVDAEGPMSLLDIPPTLVESVGVDAPDPWHGTNLLESDSEYAITIAPWHDTATVAWRDYETKLVARDADVSFDDGDGRSDVERADVDRDLEEQLQDLGYMDAG